MQVTIDTRHDTLEEALAVIQLAFAHGKDLGAAQGTAEPTGPVRRRQTSRSPGRRGSRRAADARNDAVAAPPMHDGSANPAAADTGVTATAVEDAAPGRARASAREAPTKTTAASRGATQKAAGKKAAAKTTPASRPTTKRAPASKSAASRDAVRSNTAPPGQADVVRAWARDQGMHVKAAGRMPAAVIKAYDEAHG